MSLIEREGSVTRVDVANTISLPSIKWSEQEVYSCWKFDSGSIPRDRFSPVGGSIVYL